MVKVITAGDIDFDSDPLKFCEWIQTALLQYSINIDLNI